MSTDAPSGSVAELTRELTEQTSRLAQREIELAKVELTEKGRQAGIGLGAFGGAGLVAVLGLGALIAAAIVLLATTMATWLAAAIIAAALFAVAGVLALMGKAKVAEASPPVPRGAVETVKADVQEAKTRAQEGRA